MGGIDGGEGTLNLVGRIDTGDQLGVERDAVARRRASALEVHLLVKKIHILSQIVDGNALKPEIFRHKGAILARCLEIRDALPKNGDEISHHMRNRFFDSEEESVEVTLADAETNLSAQANVELILVTASSTRPP